jgi:hypothetical protein
MPSPRRAFLPTSWAARLSLDLDRPAGVIPKGAGPVKT